MRVHGTLTDPTGVGPGDHVCWTYERAGERRRVVANYLAEGVARGERLAYLADKPTAEELLADLELLEGAAELAEGGDLLLVPIREAYAPNGSVDARARIDGYRDAARLAVELGYAGLRIAADATCLAAEEQTRHAFLRYEHLVDHMIAGEPVVALCAYDRGQLDAEVLAYLHSMHPLHHHRDIDFAVYADDGRSMLTGEVDAASFDRFNLALEALVEDERAEVVLDLGALEFIDVAGMRALAVTGERLRGSGRALVVRDASPLVTRCWEILDFEDNGGVQFVTAA